MKSLPHLLAAGLLATLGLAAIAQTPPPGPRDRMEMGQRDLRDGGPRQELRQVRMERRLAGLKLRLQIGAAQEPAWNAWVSAMRPSGGLRPRFDRVEFERMTTPERIDRLRTLRATRAAEMDRRADATKAFYAALNADQRKVFDGATLRMLRRGHGHQGRHHRHG